jgi:hypothetical protein
MHAISITLSFFYKHFKFHLSNLEQVIRNISIAAAILLVFASSTIDAKRKEFLKYVYHIVGEAARFITICHNILIIHVLEHKHAKKNNRVPIQHARYMCGLLLWASGHLGCANTPNSQERQLVWRLSD